MDRDTEKDRRPIAGRTRAPYEVAAVSTRPVSVRHAWDAAGVSWSEEARRLRLYYRTQQGPLARLRTFGVFEPVDLVYATARARACRRVGRELDRLITHGYVVWHDRTIAGTAMVADHILVGPEGVSVVQSLPKSAASDGPYISPAAGVERQQAQYRADAIVDQFARRLATGWHVVVFAAVCVDGNSPSVNPAPQVVSRRGVVNLARQRPRRLAPVQVADLAMMLEPAFPAAKSAPTN